MLLHWYARPGELPVTASWKVMMNRCHPPGASLTRMILIDRAGMTTVFKLKVEADHLAATCNADDPDGCYRVIEREDRRYTVAVYDHADGSFLEPCDPDLEPPSLGDHHLCHWNS